MGLFTKDVPLDERLAPLVHPANANARKLVAKQQDAIVSALAPSGVDKLIMVAAADGNYGVVAVITGERLLVFRGGRLERQVDLAQVSDAGLTPGPYGAHATAKPGLDFGFATFEDANAFLVQLDRRDIPPLYPEFFERILRTVGVPATQVNLLRLRERVAAMISAGGAHAYFTQTQDETARRAFEQRFKRSFPADEHVHVCDDMIDWLWAWNANCHTATRQLVAATEEGLAGDKSPLREFSGGELPSLDDWDK